MGDKKISVRTLPSGEKVHHHPPDKEHPEGKLTLIRDTSPLRERLDNALEDNKSRLEELQQRQRDLLKKKQDALDAKKVPKEKRNV